MGLKEHEMKLHDQLRHLQGLKGSNAKIAWLQENKEDAELRRLMALTYEPTVSYYFTPDKAAHTGITDGADIHSLLNEMAGMLGGRVKTGGAAKAYYQELLARTNAEGRAIIDAVLNRDVKAGIAETSVNKVWPGLVTQVPYMRCALPGPAKVKEWPWHDDAFFAYSQLKADGMYANISVDGNSTVLSSRNGQVFLNGPWMEAIGEQAKVIAQAISTDYSPSYQLHGEFLVRRDGKVLPRKDGNGIMNSVLQSGVMPGDDLEVVYAMWDAIPLAYAKAGGRWSQPYSQRFEGVKAAVANSGGAAIYCLETKVVRSWDEAVAHFVDATTRGEEGTVLKRHDAQWMDGDSREQVKMKVSFKVDLVITGFNPGNANGRHASTFGSIQGETRAEEGITPLSVGVSGMSDAVRREIHANRDVYHGAVMTVESNAVVTARDGTHSLFLPRLVEVRRDKKAADTVAEVVEQFEAAMTGRQVVKAAVEAS